MSVGFEIHPTDELKGSLVRFWDSDHKKVRFGVCGRQATSNMYFIFRITHPNPPYGMQTTTAIRVLKSNIKKNFGKVNYNEFIRENPQWSI
jgi:hypothetical protein